MKKGFTVEAKLGLQGPLYHFISEPMSSGTRQRPERVLLSNRGHLMSSESALLTLFTCFLTDDTEITWFNVRSIGVSKKYQT